MHVHVIDKKVTKVPIGTMLGWIFVIVCGYFCIDNINFFIPIFQSMLFIGVNLTISILFWKIYSKKVYLDRKILMDVSKEELAGYFDIDIATVDKWQTRKVIVVRKIKDYVNENEGRRVG